MKTVTPLSLYLIIAIPVFIVLTISNIFFQPSAQAYSADFWEHAATINEWLRDIWHPGNPHLLLDVGTPRYMPYYFVLTAIGL